MGVKLEIIGLAWVIVTVNDAALVPVPLGVVTEIGPVVAPIGTRALILVPDLTVKLVDAVPLNFTAVAPAKPVPVIETSAPTGPLVGVNDVTVGGFPPPPVTVKLEGLCPVPLGVVTEIGPVVAPLGTCAAMSPDELTTNDGSGVPLNVTLVAPVKFAPWTSTAVPTAPLVGLKDVTVGALEAAPYCRRQVDPSFDHSCCSQ
jgi:hypothetical protein